jgi:DNA-binding CsgD family transcriptional regulator
MAQKKIYDQKKLVPRQEAANMLGISVQTVSNYIERGIIAGIKKGNYTYVFRDSLEQFLSEAHDMLSIKSELENAKKDYETRLTEYQELMKQIMEDTVLAKSANSVKSSVMEAICGMCGSHDVMSPDFTRRISEILLMWLDGKDYTIIASVYGLSRERVRQIIQVGLHRIPKWKNYVEMRKEYKRMKSRITNLESENLLLKTQLDEMTLKYNAKTNTNPTDPILTKSIMDIGLSTRSTNCLRMAGVKTVFDITRLTPDDLLNINQMGKKSKMEIEEFLETNKLSLKKK